MEEQTLDTGLLESENIDFDEKSQQLLNNGYRFKTGEFISEAWEIFKKEGWSFIGYTLIIQVCMVAASFIPFVGSIAAIILAPVFNSGYFIAAQKISRGEKLEFGDFFKGFNLFGIIVPAFLLLYLFQILGFIFLIIPGLYLVVAYQWYVLISVFYSPGGWNAMEASRKLVTKKWFHFFWFLIVTQFFLQILGLLCLLVGVFVTLPLASIALYVAFERIFGTNKLEIK